MKPGKSFASLLNPSHTTQNPSSAGPTRTTRPPPQREPRETSKAISTEEMTKLLDNHAAKITEGLNKKVREQESKIHHLEGLLKAMTAKITILLKHVLHQDQGENIKSILSLEPTQETPKNTGEFPSYYCSHQEIQAAISNALSTQLQAIKKPQETGKQNNPNGNNSVNASKTNGRPSISHPNSAGNQTKNKTKP